MLDKERFPARRAVERLRDGLFDPVAVHRLTIEEKWMESTFFKGLANLEKGQAEHLCICGSYGQGKSHSILYMNDQALQKGYATSLVQLDFREVPFYRFSVVYRTIMEKLLLPGGQTFTKAWKNHANLELLEGLEMIPFWFRMILSAMLAKNKQLTPRQKALKKYRDYQPELHDTWLQKALMGADIPISNLKKIFKYREIEGYQKESLICRGNDSYFKMVLSLGELLKKMGYKGLVLFFDEGESMAQAHLRNRVKAYDLLDRFFCKNKFVYPIFAFTDDFFDKVKNESYENLDMFPQNYAQAWQDINLVRLHDFSDQKWKTLLDRLMDLYIEAYQVELSSYIKEKLYNLLQNMEGLETRFKLKSLIHRLDIESQRLE